MRSESASSSASNHCSLYDSMKTRHHFSHSPHIIKIGTKTFFKAAIMGVTDLTRRCSIRSKAPSPTSIQL